MKIPYLTGPSLTGPQTVNLFFLVALLTFISYFAEPAQAHINSGSDALDRITHPE